MAKTARTTRSQEEVLTQSAQLVAGTINPEAMGLTAEQIDVEQFILCFKEKAAEMLEDKATLLLAIGPYVNTETDGVYSPDIRTILDSIESKMHTKFDFYYGILLWLSKNDLCAVWLPD